LLVALPSSPAAATSSSDEGSLLSLTNGERSSRGIRTLSSVSDLASLAEQHSRDMAAQHAIFHNNSLPSEVGGNWHKLGENVGRGSSVSQVHNAFMGSSTHRIHILDSAYNQIGVGVVRGSDGYVYITEVFAARGVSHVVHKAVVHHVQSVSEPAVHRTASAPVHKVAPAVTPPQTIGILMDLLALDAPTPARRYIPTNRPPP
jgi:hypothetical protein